jgi:hypothetical protein
MYSFEFEKERVRKDSRREGAKRKFRERSGRHFTSRERTPYS